MNELFRAGALRALLDARAVVVDAPRSVRELPSRLRAFGEKLWGEVVRPRSTLHWLSIAILWAVVIAYTRHWLSAFSEALFNPNLQTDDARTALFPFHRYAPGAPLANDPIANEMIEYQPYAFRALYRITVPFIGLLAAAKVAQGVCLLIVLGAAFVLLLSPRAGLGAAALFAFLFLHDAFVTGRIGGGLPRSFGFPAIAFWLAGALGHRPWARRTGAVIAALTYPSALAMILGAEGLYTLRNVARQGVSTTARRLVHYGVLVAVCGALLAPAVFLGSSDGGPVHTLAQAENEPAFSRSGRLWLLPLNDPGRSFGEALTAVFKPKGEALFPSLNLQIDARAKEAALLIIAVLLLLPLLGLTPVPGTVLSFAIACFILYFVSVKYAFKLYSPERYYSYGMRTVGVGLAVSTLGFLFPRLPLQVRQPARNFAAGLVMLFAWLFLGDGSSGRKSMEMTIDYRRNAPLWEFISKLPPDIKVASHIRDGDDIPLFTQRANNGAFETLQPWLTKSWARQKARAEDTLRAFYATDRAEVLAYAKKYGVTHLLVNRGRYQGDFKKQARSFEPLSSFADTLLAERRLQELVLRHLPPEAVIYEHERFKLVDVKVLSQAWSE